MPSSRVQPGGMSSEAALRQENQRLREQVESLQSQLEVLDAQVLGLMDARDAAKRGGLVGQARVAWDIVRRAQRWPRGKPAPAGLRALLRAHISERQIDCGKRSVRSTLNEILASVAPPAAGPAPGELLLAKRALGALLGREIDPGYVGVRGRWRRLLLDTRPPTMTKSA